VSKRGPVFGLKSQAVKKKKKIEEKNVKGPQSFQKTGTGGEGEEKITRPRGLKTIKNEEHVRTGQLHWDLKKN